MSDRLIGFQIACNVSRLIEAGFIRHIVFGQDRERMRHEIVGIGHEFALLRRRDVLNRPACVARSTPSHVSAALKNKLRSIASTSHLLTQSKCCIFVRRDSYRVCANCRRTTTDEPR